MIPLQDLIHKLEVGEGVKLVRILAVGLGILVLTAAYDWLEFRNLATQEAMDAAQLARNLARGEGFTTKFVRPLSIYLVEQRQAQLQQRTNDLAMLKTPHPDLANPPVYPLFLAGLMKVLPFEFKIPPGRRFLRHQPDLLIALVNQALLFLLIFMTYRLGRRLFDATVGWLAAIALVGCEVLWRFTVSGLSTLLLLLIFAALLECVILLEKTIREGQRGNKLLVLLTAVTGAVVGVGTLTRYSFGWLILALLAFIGLYGPAPAELLSLGGTPTRLRAFMVKYFPSRRLGLGLALLVGFAGVVSPWLLRNYQLCGNFFGTAGYAVMQGTASLPENHLERSLKPNTQGVVLAEYLRKFAVNAGTVLQADLPKLGASWISAFFLVGLMIPFVDVARGRLRVFVLLGLIVLAVAQALGRTVLSERSPEIHSENLLILLAPVVFVYGCAMFVLLLDQLELEFFAARYIVSGLFILVSSAPLIAALLPPRMDPRAHPPYYPPLIQHFASWMQPEELMMSDLPWATAWYGDRQCVWTTLKVNSNTDDDFYAINDLRKPIHALYLSPVTLDEPFFTDMYKDRETTWGGFVMNCLTRTNVPPGFPLKHAPGGYLRTGHFFLTDWPRWQRRTE